MWQKTLKNRFKRRVSAVLIWLNYRTTAFWFQLVLAVEFNSVEY